MMLQLLLRSLLCELQSHFLLSVIVSLYESFNDANKLILRTVTIASMDSRVHTPCPRVH